MLPGEVPLVMIDIPGGTFMMGCRSGGGYLPPPEGPIREVTLTNNFQIGQFEVTQAQWVSVMGTKPWSGFSDVADEPDAAAVNISWEDASAFARRLTSLTGKVFRLPTEAEWEYVSLLPQAGDSQPEEDSVFNMVSGPYEWCQDFFSVFSYGNGSAVVDPLGVKEGCARVIRGGFRRYDPACQIEKDRSWDYADRHNKHYGFRLLRPLGTPDLYVDRSTVYLDRWSPSTSVVVENSGGGGLKWTALSSDSSIIVTPSTFAGGRTEVTLSGTDFDQNATAYVIFSNDENPADFEEVEVQVHGNGPVETFTLPGNVSLPMVEIPGGHFVMGSSNGESDETPAREVTIRQTFQMGQTEVTQEQWVAVMGTTPWSGQSFVQDSPHAPAAYISWNSALQFISELNQLTGVTFRLPTEAEWEYACRAGTTTDYYFGDDAADLSAYAWWFDNSDAPYASSVGQLLPNAFGLYDTHGNVGEWCMDWYDSRYYESGPMSDPAGAAFGAERVLRGGSWLDNATACRSANRSSAPQDAEDFFTGFRLVRDTGARALESDTSTVFLSPDMSSTTIRVEDKGTGFTSWSAMSDNPSIVVSPDVFAGNQAEVTISATDFGPHYTGEIHFVNTDNPTDVLRVSVDVCSDCETETIMLPGGVPLTMVAIPAGTIVLDLSGREIAAHNQFQLGQFEVTWAQWKAVNNRVSEISDLDYVTPVRNVHWDSAQAFIESLNALTGYHFRLPSDNEWEYGCRAGTTTAYSYGDDVSILGDYGNFRDGGGNEPMVGQLLPNAFGLYDMHGNVAEWCGEPIDRRLCNLDSEDIFETPEPVASRRGGSYDSAAEDCRSESYFYDILVNRPDVGFRLAR